MDRQVYTVRDSKGIYAVTCKKETAIDIAIQDPDSVVWDENTLMQIWPVPIQRVAGSVC